MSKSKPGSAKGTKPTKDNGAGDDVSLLSPPVIDERQLSYLTLEPVPVARHTSSSSSITPTPIPLPSTDSGHPSTDTVRAKGIQPRPMLPVWSDDEINHLIQTRHASSFSSSSSPQPLPTGDTVVISASSSLSGSTLHEYKDPHAHYVPLSTAFGTSSSSSSTLVMVRPDPWVAAASVVSSVKDYIDMVNGTKLTPSALLAQQEHQNKVQQEQQTTPAVAPGKLPAKGGKDSKTAVVPESIAPTVTIPSEPDLPLTLPVPSSSVPTTRILPQLLRDIIVPNADTTLSLSQLKDSTAPKPVYDVPSSIQTTMENFARIVRVLGTTVAATSITKGCWLWDLIRPDRVHVPSSSSSNGNTTDSSISSASSTVSLYYVKLFWAGEWRCLTINDSLPYTPNGYPLFLTSEDPHELWITLLWKAWYDINELSCANNHHSSSTLTNNTSDDASDPLLILHALTGWLPQTLSRTLTTSTPQDRNFTQSLLLTSLPSNIPTQGEKLREWSFASDDAALMWVRSLEQKELARKRTIEADRRRRYEAGDFATMEEAKASAVPSVNPHDTKDPGGTSYESGTLLNPLPKSIPSLVASLRTLPPEQNHGSPEDVYPLPYRTTHRPVLPVPQEPYTVAQPVIIIATARSNGRKEKLPNDSPSTSVHPHPVPLPSVPKSSLYDSTYPQVVGNEAIADAPTHLIEGDSYILVMVRTRKVKTQYTYSEHQPTIVPVPVTTSPSPTPSSAPGTRPSSAVASVPSSSPSGSPTKGSSTGPTVSTDTPPSASPTVVTPPLAIPGYTATVSHTIDDENDEWNEPMVLVVGRKYRPLPFYASSSATADTTLKYTVTLTDYLDNLTSSASITMDATIKLLLANTPGLTEKISKARLAHQKTTDNSDTNTNENLYRQRASRLERLLGLPPNSTKHSSVIDNALYQHSELFQEPSILPPLPPPGPSAPTPIDISTDSPSLSTRENATEEEKKEENDDTVRTTNTLVSNDEEAAAVARKEAEEAAQAAYEDAVAAAEAAYQEYLQALLPPDPAEHAVALIEADRSLPSHPEWIDPTHNDTWIPLTQLSSYFPDPPILCYNPWIPMDHYDPLTASAATTTGTSASSSMYTLHRHWRQAGANEVYDLPIDGSDVPKIVPFTTKATESTPSLPPHPSPSPVAPSGGKGSTTTPAPVKGGKLPAPEPVVPVEPLVSSSSPPPYTGPYVVPRTGESADQALFIPRLVAVAGGNGGVEAITSTTQLKQRVAVLLWQDTVDKASVTPESTASIHDKGVSVLVERDPVITSLIARIPAGSIAPMNGSFLPRDPQPTPFLPTLPTRTRLQLALPSSLKSGSSRFTVAVLEIGHDQGTSLDDADGDGILDGDVITPDMLDPRAPISCGTVYRVSIDAGLTGACVLFYPLPPARPAVSSIPSLTKTKTTSGYEDSALTLLTSDIHRCLEKASISFVPLTDNHTTTNGPSRTTLTVNTTITTNPPPTMHDASVLFTHPFMTIGPLARVLTTSTGLVCRQITGVAPGLASTTLLQQQQQILATQAKGSTGTSTTSDGNASSSSSSVVVSSPCYWHVWTRQSITAEWLRTNRPLTKHEEVVTQALAIEAAEKAAKDAAAAIQAQQEATAAAHGKSPSRPSSRGTATTTTPVVPPVSTTPLPSPIATNGTTLSTVPTIVTAVPTAEEIAMVPSLSSLPTVNVRLWAKLDVASKAALPYVRIFSVNHETNKVTAHPVLSTGIICIDLPLSAFQSSVPTLQGMDIDFPYLDNNNSSTDSTSNESLMIENTMVPIPSSTALLHTTGSTIPPTVSTSLSSPSSASSVSTVGISLVVAAYVPSSLMDSSVHLNPSTIGGPWCLTIIANRLTPDNLLLRTGNLISKALPVPSRYTTLRNGTCTFVPRLSGTLVKLDTLSPWGTMEVSELSKFTSPNSLIAHNGNSTPDHGQTNTNQTMVSSSPVLPNTGKTSVPTTTVPAKNGPTTSSATPVNVPPAPDTHSTSLTVPSKGTSSNAVPTFVVFSTEGVATNNHSFVVAPASSSSSSSTASFSSFSPLTMDPYTLALLPKPVPANPLVPLRLFRLCGTLSNGISPTMVGLRLELVPNIQAFITLLKEKFVAKNTITTTTMTTSMSANEESPSDGSAFSRTNNNNNNTSNSKSVRFSSENTIGSASVTNDGTVTETGPSLDPSSSSSSPSVFDETVAHKIIFILRRIQTHIGIYNVNNGELLTTGSGRGSAEIVALPATVSSIVPFHVPLPSAVPPPITVSASPTHDHGHSSSPTPGSSTHRPVSAKSGTVTTTSGKSVSSTGHSNASTTATATTTETNTKPGVTFPPVPPAVPEWSQRADQYFQWTDTVRTHVRTTVAAQEASVLNDAQFILQANILVPAHMVSLLSYIPWRLAVCGPIVKSPIPSSGTDTATTVPPVPEPAKGTTTTTKDTKPVSAPAKGGKGKEETVPPVTVLPSPSPTALLSSIGLLPSPSTANDSPLKLWIDDRVPRLVQGIRNAFTDSNNVPVVSIEANVGSTKPNNTPVTNSKVHTVNVPLPETLRYATSHPSKGLTLPLLRDDIAASLVTEAKKKRTEIELLNASKQIVEESVPAQPTKGGSKPAATPKGNTASVPVEEPVVVETSPFTLLTRNHVNDLLAKHVSSSSSSVPSPLSTEEVRVRNHITSIAKLPSPYLPSVLFPSIVSLHDVQQATTTVSNKTATVKTLPSVLTGTVPNSSVHPETSSFTAVRQKRRTIAKALAASRTGILSLKGNYTLSYAGNGLYHHVQSSNGTITGANLVQDNILDNEEVIDPHYSYGTGTDGYPDPSTRKVPYVSLTEARMATTTVGKDTVARIAQPKDTTSTYSMNTTLQVTHVYNQALHQSIRREQISRVALLHSTSTLLPSLAKNKEIEKEIKECQSLRKTFTNYQTYQDIMQAVKMQKEQPPGNGSNGGSGTNA